MKSLLILLTLIFCMHSEARVTVYKMYDEPSYEADQTCDLYVEMQYYNLMGRGFIRTQNKLVGECEATPPNPYIKDYQIEGSTNNEVDACINSDIFKDCVHLSFKGKHLYLRLNDGSYLYSENAPRLQ